MNTRDRWLRIVGGRIALFWIVAAVAIGLALTLLSQSLADSPDPKAPSEMAAPMGRRGFIGMPDASKFSIQNISTETAHITVTIALPNGTVIDTSGDQVPPESIHMYSDPEGLISLARTSTDMLEYVFGVNCELAELGNDAYLGLEWEKDASPPPPILEPKFLMIPHVQKAYDGWATFTAFAIQNRSDEIAAVAVEFYDQTGHYEHFEEVSIPASGAASLSLAGIEELSDGYIGSAIIASDQPVAVVNLRTYDNYYKLRSAYQGRGSWETSNVLVAPALFKARDWQTSQICVQNGGDWDTDVSVSYSDGLTVTATIPSYAMHCFDQGTEGHAAGWLGGAVIAGEAEDPLVAVVNVIAYDGATPVGRWSYTVPAQKMITQTLSFPLLFTDHDGWTSEIHLYNFSDSPSEVTPRYISYPAGFVYCADSFTIPAHSMLSISQDELPPFFDLSMAYFSATQPVAAAVGVTSDEPLGDTDRHFGYGAAYPEGPVSFPDTCDTIHDVFLPVVLRRMQ
jgi:hypothetical protein